MVIMTYRIRLTTQHSTSDAPTSMLWDCTLGLSKKWCRCWQNYETLLENKNKSESQSDFFVCCQIWLVHVAILELLKGMYSLTNSNSITIYQQFNSKNKHSAIPHLLTFLNKSNGSAQGLPETCAIDFWKKNPYCWFQVAHSSCAWKHHNPLRCF